MSETRGRLTVRRGTVRDADTMLALFDDAVRWLTERGHTGQWGTAPFSAIPQRVQQVRGWGAAGALRVAERDEAAGLGLAKVRVDCWAGGGGALVQYYVRAGFTPVETVQVEAWTGRVLEVRV
ncbi:hypothetical protein [Crossiella sp. CA198]|uniref:hypothetical protein n=1 Tax=Crossiella sp. CA198 TaxID=3455607 RepID=UPI003F8D3A89